jgi:VanZ family protein
MKKPSARRERLGRWLAAIAWMGVIYLLSARSSFPVLTPALPELQSVIAHAIEYGILALLLARAWASLPAVRNPTLWTILTVMVYAASDEWHQMFVPGRHTDLLDWLTDLTGAVLALALARGWRALRQRRQQPPSPRSRPRPASSPDQPPALAGSGSRRTTPAARR